MNENLGKLIKYKDFKIKSWCDDVISLWKFFINTVKENGIIVEIGVHGGGSLLKTADLLINKNIKLFGIASFLLKFETNIYISQPNFLKRPNIPTINIT